METYISMLRGINVSGQKKILMADLKLLYEDLKFKNVVTYIQSGNVIFKFKAADDKELSQKIEKAILKKYGFEVPVIIRSITEIQKVLSSNPFDKEPAINKEKLYVTFLEQIPSNEKLEKVKTVDYAPDRFIIINKEIYLYCEGGYGNTKLSNNFFESQLKLKATTRNMKTINQLLKLAME